MSDENIVKSHCNRCGQQTKHFVRFKHGVEDSQKVDGGPYSVEWGSIYTVLECCGCEDVTLRRQEWCSEWSREDGTVDTFYPPRVSRRKPAFFGDIPVEYASLLEEIYSALHADSRRLAVMGARALIDVFIAQKVGDKGSFAKGMEALEAAGFITNKNSLIIKAAIDTGHAAAHRGHVPSERDVLFVMDIIENLIQHDILSKSAESLRESTPPRQRKTK